MSKGVELEPGVVGKLHQKCRTAPGRGILVDDFSDRPTNFDPEEINLNAALILNLLKQLHSMTNGRDGVALVFFGLRKDGDTWTEHKDTIQKLVELGIAIGKVVKGAKSRPGALTFRLVL